MAVTLTVSETLSGAAINDSLAGGGSGLDLGQVTNGSYSNVVSKTANTGAQHLYIRHDATVDPITGFSAYIEQYGVGTGFTYGGANTAAADYTSIKNLGNASGSSKNNADGLSGGFWMDMDAFASTTNQFDQATYPSIVKIFGDDGTDGIDLASAFLIHQDAMVYDNSGVETDATSPVAGQIGKSGDTVKGDRCHLKFRMYLPAAHPDGGIHQFELVFAYSYTA